MFKVNDLVKFNPKYARNYAAGKYPNMIFTVMKVTNYGIFLSSPANINYDYNPDHLLFAKKDYTYKELMSKLK